MKKTKIITENKILMRGIHQRYGFVIDDVYL